MTSKDIVDGADATIIAELDEAAEARIIDVLARVFTTNKYLDLKETICRAMDRHHADLIEQAKRAAEKQFYAQQAAQQAARQPTYGSTAGYEEYMRQKWREKEASIMPPSFWK